MRNLRQSAFTPDLGRNPGVGQHHSDCLASMGIGEQLSAAASARIIWDRSAEFPTRLG